MICREAKADYFSFASWTTQITLNRFVNYAPTRSRDSEITRSKRMSIYPSPIKVCASAVSTASRASACNDTITSFEPEHPDGANP
jgi:hypothetical protein